LYRKKNIGANAAAREMSHTTFYVLLNERERERNAFIYQERLLQQMLLLFMILTRAKT
jgi:hypothetical protein